MKAIRLFFICSCLLMMSYKSENTPTINVSILNGPDGYFKTYEDFIKGNYIPFEKVSYRDAWKGKPLTIWFTSNNQKAEFEPDNIWGYRKGNQLYRITADLGKHGGMWRVIAIGDWVLYFNPFYDASLSKDKSVLIYSSDAFTSYSKNLNSTMSFAPDIPVSGKNEKDFLNCHSSNITKCFFESVHVNFVLGLNPVKTKGIPYEYQQVGIQIKTEEKPH